MGGVYSLVRYRATERNEATEDYWLHTLLSHLLLDQEEDEGRDEWIRPLPHCFGNENTDTQSLQEFWSAVLYDWTWINAPECRMSHQTFESVLQEKKRQGIDVKILWYWFLFFYINEQLTQGQWIRTDKCIFHFMGPFENKNFSLLYTPRCLMFSQRIGEKGRWWIWWMKLLVLKGRSSPLFVAGWEINFLKCERLPATGR